MSKSRKINNPLLKAVLDRFEGVKAVLVFEDGAQFVIERRKLGSEFKEGDVLQISFVKMDILSEEQSNLMRKKLANILNNTNETA
jgi:hypothetical protein